MTNTSANVKIGDPIPEKRPQAYELDVGQHVSVLDPSKYGSKDPIIDPVQYFITSGDAVAKSKAMLRDIAAVAAKAKGRYGTAAKKVVQQAQTLITNLELARGDACFLETEWEDHVLYVIPKNPRDKTPAA